LALPNPQHQQAEDSSAHQQRAPHQRQVDSLAQPRQQEERPNRRSVLERRPLHLLRLLEEACLGRLHRRVHRQVEGDCLDRRRRRRRRWEGGCLDSSRRHRRMGEGCLDSRRGLGASIFPVPRPPWILANAADLFSFFLFPFFSSLPPFLPLFSFPCKQFRRLRRTSTAAATTATGAERN
jgi:hypothetical protein